MWGKIRGRQVSVFLAKHIPSAIGGPCKRVAADMIALLTAHRDEKAQKDGGPLTGVVIDIVKCYNTWLGSTSTGWSGVTCFLIVSHKIRRCGKRTLYRQSRFWLLLLGINS